MDKKKICDIAVDITKSGVITGIKTLAEKSFVCSWIKNWYEEYGQVSGERRTTLVENEFTSKFLKLENELGKEKILNTPNLASLFTTTYQSAMTDVSEDKVSFYANTLVNAIRNENIDDVKTHIFLNMLRKYSKMHIDILKECLGTHCSTVDTILDDIFCKRTNYVPENKIHPIRLIDRRFHTLDMRYQIIAELYNDNLFDVYVDNSRIHPHASSGINKELSSLAVEFLAFITEQEAKND